MEGSNPRPATVSQEPAEANPQPPSVRPKQTRLIPRQAGSSSDSGRGYPQTPPTNPSQAIVEPQPSSGGLSVARVNPEASRADTGPSHKSSEPAEANPQLLGCRPKRARAVPEEAQAAPGQARAYPKQARADPEQAETNPEHAQGTPEQLAEHSSSSGADTDSDDEDPSVRPKEIAFKKGQVVFFEAPYSAVLSDAKIKTTCSFCFNFIPTSVAFTPCERCGKIIYCNDECFAEDGPNHEVECEVFLHYEGIPPEYDRLGVRVMSRHMRETARGEVNRAFFFQYERRIDNIVSHIQRTNEATIALLREKAQMLKIKMDRAHRIDVSVDEFVEIFLKIRINAQFVYDSLSRSVSRLGSALFLAASKMDHTCSPIDNYVLTFTGPNLVVTALEAFTLEKPSKLKTNYIQIAQPLRDRRRELSHRWYFYCRCRRCKSDKGADERNLPAGLRAFMNRPASVHWEQRAREFYDIIQNFPPKNYFRYTLAYKLQFLCSRQGNLVPALRYGIAALQGCMRFEERKQVLYLLCHDMARLGYNNRRHPNNTEFEITRRSAVNLFGMLFERSHDMVKELKRIAHGRNRNIVPRRRYVTT